MFGLLAFGTFLLHQNDAATVIKSNQEAATKLVLNAGLPIGSGPNGIHTLSRNGAVFAYGVSGINARPEDPIFAILGLSSYYRPSDHVSMQAILDRCRASFVHFYQRVNGDIEVTATIPLRRGETQFEVRDAVGNCFGELFMAELGGLNLSDGSATRPPNDPSRIKMSKVVDYLSDEDLAYLTDEVWGWRDRTQGGTTGAWSHPIIVNGTRIVLGHPENMRIGPANGIGLDGRVAETTLASDQLLKTLQDELGPAAKIFYARGTPDKIFGVQALLAYGDGLSLQQIHDRIEKFASVMTKHE